MPETLEFDEKAPNNTFVPGDHTLQPGRGTVANLPPPHFAPMVPAAPPDPLTIIQQAISAGMKTDDLGRLFDMQERHERDRRRVSFNTALNAAVKETPKVYRSKEHSGLSKPANGNVPAIAKKYAPLEDIQQIVMPHLISNGFTIARGEQECAVPGCVAMWLELRHAEGHVERSWIMLPILPHNAMMNPTQAKIGTMTYGDKKLLAMATGAIIADEDRDGNVPPDKINEAQAIEMEDLIRELADLGHWSAKSDEWLTSALGCKIVTDADPKKWANTMQLLKQKVAKIQKGGKK